MRKLLTGKGWLIQFSPSWMYIPIRNWSMAMGMAVLSSIAEVRRGKGP